MLKPAHAGFGISMRAISIHKHMNATRSRKERKTLRCFRYCILCVLCVSAVKTVFSCADRHSIKRTLR
jgi:succinate dehydrogenase/fumarate reductase-like Fe-S protein